MGLLRPFGKCPHGTYYDCEKGCLDCAEPLNQHDALNSMCDCAACTLKAAGHNEPQDDDRDRISVLDAYRRESFASMSHCYHGVPDSHWCPDCADFDRVGA